MFTKSEISELEALATDNIRLIYPIHTTGYIMVLRISDFLSLKCVEEIEKEPSRARQLVSHLFNPKHKRTHRTVRC